MRPGIFNRILFLMRNFKGEHRDGIKIQGSVIHSSSRGPGASTPHLNPKAALSVMHVLGWHQKELWKGRGWGGDLRSLTACAEGPWKLQGCNREASCSTFYLVMQYPMQRPVVEAVNGGAELPHKLGLIDVCCSSYFCREKPTYWSPGALSYFWR